MNDALCVGICMIDWDEGICIGCGRTADEIARQMGQSPEAPRRLAAGILHILAEAAARAAFSLSRCKDTCYYYLSVDKTSDSHRVGLFAEMFVRGCCLK